MSQRQTKKFRKEVRRRVDKNFGVGMQALNQIIKPRPRWIPKRLWMLAYLPLFEKRHRRIIYKYID